MAGTTHNPRFRTWQRASRGLRRELSSVIPPGELRELHRRRPWRHFLVAARLAAILAVTTWALWRSNGLLAWVPLILLQGLVFFDSTVLLHEALHHLVWQGSHPGRDRVLSLVYATFTGLSASQFTRWHLDHHASLGSPTDDPKRHHLSPKVNSRLVKLLYFTPALFVLYFRAARRETSTYPPHLRSVIRRERLAASALHLGMAAALWTAGGPWLMVRVHLAPLFLAFPVWFALNRLGQHYWIDPEDPARWGTLVRGSPVWDFLFLWSNHHLEHHYFPGVPFYNLPRVQSLLEPFYRSRGMEAVGYGRLLWGWLVLNRPPHSEWRQEADSAPRGGPGTGYTAGPGDEERG